MYVNGTTSLCNEDHLMIKEIHDNELSPVHNKLRSMDSVAKRPYNGVSSGDELSALDNIGENHHNSVNSPDDPNITGGTHSSPRFDSSDKLRNP